MKIAAAQAGLSPRQLSTRSPARREKAAPGTKYGKVRHVLHGWRILLAPIVAQVLERSSLASGPVPVEYAQDAYRRRLADVPAQRVLRDI